MKARWGLGKEVIQTRAR